MQKCGDIDDCISTPEAAELATSLDEKEISNLPLPGQVDFINGGPPCQVIFYLSCMPFPILWFVIMTQTPC